MHLARDGGASSKEPGISERGIEAPQPVQSTPSSLAQTELHEIVAALERNGWVQYKAAADLGLTSRQIGYRVRKFHLETQIAAGRAALRRTGL